MRPLRVLLVEDNREDAELWLRELRCGGFEPAYQRVETAEAFRDALSAGGWDIVLSDYTMPRFRAMEALQILRTQTDTVPFIVVTWSIDEDTAVDCLKRGVDDYIVKERLARLTSAVEQALRAYEDRRRYRRLENEIRQGQKMEALGTLATGIAHDFNNALTAIVGFAELARIRAGDNPEVAQAIEGVMEAAHQATGITKSLLTFSPETPIRKSPVRLVPLLGKTIEMLRHMLPPSIEIETDSSSAEQASVDGDATQLQQVILNLAVNSRDAMPHGGALRFALIHEPNPTGDVFDAVASRGKGAAILTVEDTGMGMPEEVRVRIFDPFFTTKARSAGTGLGMAIVHSIVRAHNGKIDIESTLGCGTRITVALPCCDAPVPGVTPPVAVGDRPGYSETILLAEDNAQVSAIMGGYLRSLGYKILQAHDGLDALRVFGEHRDDVQLVILDVEMPKLTGPVCLSKIRAIRADIPIIMITGRIDLQLCSEGAPRTWCLTKPFPATDLAAAVRTALLAGYCTDSGARPAQ